MSYIKRRITTTLPTTLEEGEEIYYQDANGVQNLWVGRSDGTAWPACGYKKIAGTLAYSGSLSYSIFASDFGAVVPTYTEVGAYAVDLGSLPSGAKVSANTETVQSGGAISTYSTFTYNSFASVVNLYKKLLSDNSASDSDTLYFEIKYYYAT